MKVLFVSNEVAPYAKVGGLGDVAGSLPPALAGRGIEIAVAMPLHRQCLEHGGLQMAVEDLPVEMAGETVSASVLMGSLDGGVPVYFIRYDPYFDRPEIYGEGGVDYPDAAARYAFFCRAVQALPEAVGFDADVIHTNDWPTGPVSAFVTHSDLPRATVYTIHNLAYQGQFPLAQAAAGVSGDPALLKALTHDGELNFMAAGIRTATLVSTVSERYAEEIKTEIFGAGLDELLRARAADLFGIRNGIDGELWNPATDRALPVNYSADDLSGKARCKAGLQEEVGLPVADDIPLVGCVTRMAWQKGLDILSEVIPEAVNWPMQFVVLGEGEPAIEKRYRQLSVAHPQSVAVIVGFDEGLARRIYAGADMFVMPSRYEPCGLGQMIAMAYGTVPVVSWTGGLADTVSEEPHDRNGFILHETTTGGLLSALGRANETWHDPEAWAAVVRAGLARDFSWDDSARRYEELYRTALERAGS
ncbi:MAG: glycogen synthase [Armatimonadetes bacterium]|nr:glycogen synthase [Armatimonadota bacterium]